MLCVLILYISGETYSLKSTTNDKFFEKLFTAILFTLRVFTRNLLRGNRWRNTFRISFWCLAWDLNPGFSSNKPTHYLLDHGDFRVFTDSLQLRTIRNLQQTDTTTIRTNRFVYKDYIRFWIWTRNKKISDSNTLRSEKTPAFVPIHGDGILSTHKAIHNTLFSMRIYNSSRNITSGNI